MITKSIRLTEEEAAEVKKYVEVTGEVEASALRRASLRGIREMRLEQGILAFIQGKSSSEAAEIAGVPRAPFLHLLMERGITLLDGPSTLPEELEDLAKTLGSNRLTAAAETIREARSSG